MHNYVSLSFFSSHYSHCTDKLDAVGTKRRKKRLLSEVDAEAEELSLTEYLARKMEGEAGPRKKRVSPHEWNLLSSLTLSLSHLVA